MTDTAHDVGRGTTVSRPNVLFIMADDHAANSISATHNQVRGVTTLGTPFDGELQVEIGDVEHGAAAPSTAREDGR